MAREREGILITEVTPRSPAHRAGVRAGDRLLRVADRAPRDWWDYRFLAAAPRVTVEVERDPGRSLRLEVRNPDFSDLGLRFAQALFDRVITCRNHCLFCFVDQLPRGLRPSLYVKDDDYRLSFAEGNYVSLTNLTAADEMRIVQQRLTPLRVSVQATDPEVRRRLLRCPPPGDIMGLLTRLAQAGIAVHAQVVLCPGYNDGPMLEQTLRDLEKLGDSLVSLAIVPVGLTRHRENLTPLTPVDDRQAAYLIEWVEAHQRRLRARRGRNLIYLADEMYLLAGEPFPAYEQYDGFPQLENGVGMAALFQRQWTRERDSLPRRLPFRDRLPFRRRRVTVVTSRAAFSILRPIVEDLNDIAGLEVDLRCLSSSFWGEAVTVAGLLTGSDLWEGLKQDAAGETVLIPGSCVDGRGRFLDGMTVTELAEKLGRPVRPVFPDARHLRMALLGSGVK